VGAEAPSGAAIWAEAANGSASAAMISAAPPRRRAALVTDTVARTPYDPLTNRQMVAGAPVVGGSQA
jgi:hypothetical protein